MTIIGIVCGIGAMGIWNLGNICCPACWFGTGAETSDFGGPVDCETCGRGAGGRGAGGRKDWMCYPWLEHKGST